MHVVPKRMVVESPHYSQNLDWPKIKLWQILVAEIVDVP